MEQMAIYRQIDGANGDIQIDGWNGNRSINKIRYKDVANGNGQIDLYITEEKYFC